MDLNGYTSFKVDGHDVDKITQDQLHQAELVIGVTADGNRTVLKNQYTIIPPHGRELTVQDQIEEIEAQDRATRDRKLQILNDSAYGAFSGLSQFSMVLGRLVPDGPNKTEQLELVSGMMTALSQRFDIKAPEGVVDEILANGV